MCVLSLLRTFFFFFIWQGLQPSDQKSALFEFMASDVSSTVHCLSVTCAVFLLSHICLDASLECSVSDPVFAVLLPDVLSSSSSCF